MNRVLAFLILSATFCTGYLLGLAIDSEPVHVPPPSLTFEMSDGRLFKCQESDGPTVTYTDCQRVEE